MTLQQPKPHDLRETESRANDLVKRIRKLRWMGMEEEAERLQAELTRRNAAADSVIATPRDTDWIRHKFGTRTNIEGENAMEVIVALAVLFAIWVLVIWGSSYFNKNVV
jgi:hypothetical protein